MTTPISSHSMLPSGNKLAHAEEKDSGQESRQGKAGSSTAGVQDDAVSVSRAAQVLNEQTTERGQGVIQSAEQAAQAAQGLKALFEEHSTQALAAQSKNVSSGLMGLLKVS